MEAVTNFVKGKTVAEVEAEIGKINAEIFNCAPAINFGLTIGRHEQNGASVGRLKAQEEVQKDERIGVPINQF